MKLRYLKHISIGAGLCLAFVLGVTLQSVTPLVHLTEARGIVKGPMAPFDSSNPAAPAGVVDGLTYQGRLTNHSGTPINGPVSATFTLYDLTNSWLYSATRTITPTNGLFTIYLGADTDPNLFDGQLGAAAFVGVAVGGDGEMTPRQPLTTIVGHGLNGAGVIGNSLYGDAVIGTSTYGNGVIGFTNYDIKAGVYAQGANASGTALQIATGGIKVTGASGFDSNTFAFVHESFVTNTVGNHTFITNSLTDGDRGAMLFVTAVNDPSGYGGNNDFNMSFGVFYDTNIGHWAIYREDGQATSFPANATFNVMVIKR